MPGKLVGAYYYTVVPPKLMIWDKNSSVFLFWQKGYQIAVVISIFIHLAN